ncbi:DUF1707 domain-containing protein [Propionibacteriaceae bacterium G1746]|uniref:DUF1707 SHOCT-like domain-containing protein n=1 Tax=Aestuariimicrobium sp. G57 TaxID=3418485 RepID=UPI003C169019
MKRDQRVGYDERDEAVRRLQDHMAAGRLDMSEFEDRMAKAMSAKVAGDLEPLFVDLPEAGWPIIDAPAPGPVAIRPAASGATLTLHGQATAPVPWYSSGWIFGVAIAVMMVSQMRAWPVLVIAIVLFTLGNQMRSRSRRTLTADYIDGDLESEMLAYVRVNRKIEGIKRYREVTGAGLREAKDAVEAIERRHARPGPYEGPGHYGGPGRIGG